LTAPDNKYPSPFFGEMPGDAEPNPGAAASNDSDFAR
jgi:hypothetical protein